MTDDFDQGVDDSQWALGKLGNERTQVSTMIVCTNYRGWLFFIFCALESKRSDSIYQSLGILARGFMKKDQFKTNLLLFIYVWQDFDLDSEFGAVEAGTDIEGVIEMKAGMNQGAVHEFNLKVSNLFVL